MNKITIVKNPNGDTRTAPKYVTFEQFQKANRMHRDDVFKTIQALADTLFEAGRKHDFTKISREREFYNDFCNTMNNGSNFVESDWYKMHVSAERHHLLSDCPDDVDLIDILEMIADCVCAGMSRSGEVRDIELDDEILHKAVNNTISKLVDSIEVVEGQAFDKKNEISNIDCNF